MHRQTAAYADAVPRSFWLDSLPPRATGEPLSETIDADLGLGFDS